MAYLAYELSASDRTKLARIFPPKFSDFIGHHCTYKFGVMADAPLPPEAVLRVVGFASDDSLECLVVDVDGSIRRPDRGTFHITWSLDRSKGRKPVDSNELLRGGYTPIRPITVSATPKLFK